MHLVSLPAFPLGLAQALFTQPGWPGVGVCLGEKNELPLFPQAQQLALPLSSKPLGPSDSPTSLLSWGLLSPAPGALLPGVS